RGRLQHRRPHSKGSLASRGSHLPRRSRRLVALRGHPFRSQVALHVRRTLFLKIRASKAPILCLLLPDSTANTWKQRRCYPCRRMRRGRIPPTRTRQETTMDDPHYSDADRVPLLARAAKDEVRPVTSRCETIASRPGQAPLGPRWVVIVEANPHSRDSLG